MSVVRDFLRITNKAATASKPMSDVELGPKPLAAVFVPREGHPSILHAHLPILCKVASMAFPQSLSTRLVWLPKGAEERLASALRLPRVGIVGIVEAAPGSASVIDYVRQHVRAVEVPWVELAKSGVYLPVKIKTIQTTTPVNSKSKGPQQDESNKAAESDLVSRAKTTIRIENQALTSKTMSSIP